MTTRNRRVIPNLEPHCGSWIISGSDGKAIFETFTRKVAERVKPEYRVETALQYLARFNKEVRNA